MLTHLASLQLVLDLGGIFVFALSGGLAGVRKGLDLFGILVLAIVTALGGGVVRDLILDVPVVGVSDWRFVLTASAGGLLTFWAAPHVVAFSRPIKVFDALGLALFCVSASVKALAVGATPTASVIVGVFTAVGGGMMRDVLCGVVPEVLRRELYAVPALLGSTVVVLARAVGLLDAPAIWAAVALAFGLRILGILKRWEAPRARRDLTDHAPRPVK